MIAISNNYLTMERDEWLACKKGRFSSSDCYRLFQKGSRDMTTEELAARPRYIKKNGEEGAFLGGTTIETMFGDGAVNYIREKVDELISGNPNGEEEKYPALSEYKQIEWGNSNEYDGLRRFEVVTGKSIIYYGGNSPRFYPYGDYAGCSPDADVVGEMALTEMKCPYNTDVHTRRLLYKTTEEFKGKEWKEYCQCQCQMKITGNDLVYFCSYDPRKSYKFQQMKIIKVKADAEWQNEFDSRLTAAILLMKTMLQDSEKYLIIE